MRGVEGAEGLQMQSLALVVRRKVAGEDTRGEEDTGTSRGGKAQERRREASAVLCAVFGSSNDAAKQTPAFSC